MSSLAKIEDGLLTDAEAEAFVRSFLPDFVDALTDGYISHTEGLVDDPDAVAAAKAGFEEARDEMLAGLEKMATGELQKRRTKPLSMERHVAVKARTGLQALLTTALHAAGQKAVDLVRTRLAKVSGSDIASELDLSDVKRLTVEIGDYLGMASGDAAQRILVQIGPDTPADLIQQSSDAAVQWARDHAAEMLGQHISPDGTIVDAPVDGYDITQSTRDMVARIVSDGLANGDSVDDIAQRIQDVGFSADRAALIAETEVGNASSYGSLQGMMDAAQSGVDVQKAWETVGDDDVDDVICGPNEDQGPIPLDQPFQSGHMAPLGHARCRCTLVAYIGDSAS